jgi:hypothetical protein
MYGYMSQCACSVKFERVSGINRDESTTIHLYLLHNYALVSGAQQYTCIWCTTTHLHLVHSNTLAYGAQQYTCIWCKPMHLYLVHNNALASGALQIQTNINIFLEDFLISLYQLTRYLHGADYLLKN